MDLEKKREIISEEGEHIKQAHSVMSKWTLQERAVQVKCTFYVLAVLIPCAVLVVGSLIIGLFVGPQRVQVLGGVDPFNVTTFTWIFAGFVLIVAKSLRVAD